MRKRLTAVVLSLAVAAHAADPVQATIDKGLAYLKSQQQPDGGWQASDRMPVGITALVAKAFVQDPAYGNASPVTQRGFKKLLSYQAADGGIYKDLLASYNTAIAVSTLVAAKNPEYRSQIDKAVAYLKTLQWTQDTRPEFTGQNEANAGKQVVSSEDDPFYGGWGYGGRGRGAGRPDLSNTQFAVEALHDAGVPADDPAMQRALKFVARLQNDSETNTADWAGNDGGFVYGPSADRKGESPAGSTTDADGKRRLRSMGTMSYAGLKSMAYAGLSKDDPRVRAAWGWVNGHFTLDENVGMAAAKPENAKSGMFYGYMTLSKALAAYGEPAVKTIDGKTVDWRQALIEKSAATQSADGSWVGINHEMENNPVLVTAYVVLALEDARADLKMRPAK